MPKNDGEVIFEVRADISGVSKDMKNAETETKKHAENIEKSISDSIDEASKDAKKSLNALEESMSGVEHSAKDAGKSVDQIDSDAVDGLASTAVIAAESMDDVAESSSNAAADIALMASSSEDASVKMDKLKQTASGIGTGLKTVAGVGTAAFAAIGGAAVALGSSAVGSAVSMDQALNSLEATTGASSASMEKYEEVLKSVYKNNYGEDFQDIADGISLVTKNLGDMTDEQLQSVTESAFALRDTFEYDLTESTRAAKAMMDNFGTSGEEAMSLIAAGAQNGLDYSGEMIDSINEYSVQFAKLGYSADDMFSIMQKGADSGAWNLDKVGDAIKEFSIRAIDGSKTTAEGFDAIGLNADAMAQKFSAGGETAKNAFSETINAIQALDDPIAQEAAGVALFGTQWEDLGKDAVFALADIEEGAYDTADAMDGIKDVKYDDLGSMFEGLKRSVELLVLPLGEELIPVLSGLIEDVMPMIEEYLPDVIDLFGQFLSPVLELAEGALPGLSDIISSVMTNVMQPMTENVLPAITGAFDTLKEPLMLLISDALPPLLDLFTSIVPIIAELAATLLPPLIDVFTALMPPITELIKTLLPPLLGLFESVMPIIEALAPVIGVLANLLSKTLGKAIEFIMPIISGVIDVLASVIDFICDKFMGDWEGAWGTIVEVFKFIINLIPTIFESVINGAIGVVNGIISGINKISSKVGITAIPEIGKVTLPKFHTGGIVDFDGEYENTIIARDGEMILTESQQRRLFDIANGIDFEHPSAYGEQSIVNNYYEETTEITNQNEFTVRNDRDIELIAERLGNLQSASEKSKGW